MLAARLLAPLLAITASAAVAQTPPPGRSIDSAGPPISVYLITIGQGDPYWTRFGHNALWIRDRERKTDIAYNWGLFDFNEPGFLPRFLSGNTRYWMAGFDTWEMVDVYRSENRSIEVQELALTPQAARELRDFAAWNALPENRAYRYDYYLDNCSTRIRDALDRVIAGQIRVATDSVRTSHTYRWHTQRLLAEHAPTYGGIMLVLGQPADRAISAWDEMFIPMLMRDHLRRVQVSDGRGGTRPLIANEWPLFEAMRAPERATAPDRTVPYAIVGGIGALLIAVLAWFGTRGGNKRGLRIAAAWLAGAWSVVAGIAGSVAIGMWAFTHHVFMYGNENVLQAMPLSLAVAGLLPFVAGTASHPRAEHTAEVLALTVFGASLAGFIGQGLPMMYQTNGEIIALALPLHAATAFAVRLFVHRAPAAHSQPSVLATTS